MGSLINDLFNFTAVELNETAWIVNLPLNHGVALYSFLEAIRDYGELRVGLNDRERTAKFSLSLTKKRRTKNFITTLSYETILSGWKNMFKASPQSLYDSIHQIYDQIGEEIEKEDKSFFHSEEFGWFKRFRTKSPINVRKLMESHFLEYFFKYHEGVLLPYYPEDSSDFQEPKIFPEIIKEFPLNMLHNAIVDKEIDHVFSVGPCSEYVLETFLLDTPSDECSFDNYY